MATPPNAVQFERPTSARRRAAKNWGKTDDPLDVILKRMSPGSSGSDPRPDTAEDRGVSTPSLLPARSLSSLSSRSAGSSTTRRNSGSGRGFSLIGRSKAMTESRSRTDRHARNKQSVFHAAKKKKRNRLSAVEEDHLNKEKVEEPVEPLDVGLDVDVDLYSESSQDASKASDRPASQSSMLSAVITKDPADDPLPCAPLCGKCQSIKVTDTLPLKPDQLQVWRKTAAQGIGQGLSAPTRRSSKMPALQSSRAGSRVSSRVTSPAPGASPLLPGQSGNSVMAGHDPSTAPGADALLSSRVSQRQTLSPMVAPRVTFRGSTARESRFVKDQRLSFNASVREFQEFDGPRRWTKKVESLKISSELAKSWFSDTPYSGPNPAVVLRRLTAKQVTVLEGWAVNHVKRIALEVCAKVHARMPREGMKQREAIQSATICQLVRRSQDNKLTNAEFEFMLARLKHYPLLRDFPPDFLRDVYKRLRVTETVRGGEVFGYDHEIDGLYILVQGEVELRPGGAKEGTIDADILYKEAPATLQFSDLVAPHVNRPFLLRPEEQRFWSHSCVVRDDEDSASLAMFLFVPLDLITMVAYEARKKESKELVSLIVSVFAPAVRISERLCAKYSEIFELETFVRSHAIVQQNAKPPLHGKPKEVAKFGVIIEGTVQLVTITQAKQARKATKDIIGPGKLVGESALYGEEYPHYALCVSDLVKVLRVKVSDYFQYLLQRTTVLERPGGPPELSGALDPDDESEHWQDDRSSSNLLSWRRTELRIKRDAKNVKDKEWKLVPNKCMLAWRTPPSARPHQSIGVSASVSPSQTIAVADLNYPRDFDLFPSVQRSVMKSIAPDEGSASCSTGLPSGYMATHSTTFALSGTASMLASLDEKIRREAAQAEEIETEHYLHNVLGVYLEDAERPPTAAVQMAQRRSPQLPSPSPPLVKPPSRTAVLMTCGPLSARSQPKASVSSVSVPSAGVHIR